MGRALFLGRKRVSIVPAQYVRRQFPVMAIQVTAANMEEVAKWCGGHVCLGRQRHISADIVGAKSTRQSQAIVSDWVVLSEEDGTPKLKFYSNGAFVRTFVENNSPFDPEVSAKILRLAFEMKGLLTNA